MNALPLAQFTPRQMFYDLQCTEFDISKLFLNNEQFYYYFYKISAYRLLFFLFFFMSTFIYLKSLLLRSNFDEIFNQRATIGFPFLLCLL